MQQRDRRHASLIRRALLAALLACGLSLAATAGAQAAPKPGHTGLLVTVVARECPTYDDIRANLARNNIQESLQDLGADTLYESGQPINPKLELEGQPNCKPIPEWQFTLGSGIKEKAVTGPWGALSIVTGAESPTVKTEESTPLLGWKGEPIAGQSLAGATTFELNEAQAKRSAAHDLWIQGGTITDPVLFSDPKFEGEYGFGALRCSIDNLNGDNVETIDFPAGTTHAFCYAYYVTPPPSSGTIIMRKEVTGSGAVAQNFQFGGNVSYNPGGVFDLSAAPGKPGEAKFFRAETRPGDEPWTVNEEVPPGWVLTGLHCTSAHSGVSTDLIHASVSINLVAGDTVTCTYTDAPKPPKGELLLAKVTEGGTGAFEFDVEHSDGSSAASARIATVDEGVAAYAKPITLDPGSYKVLERAPNDPRGVWHAVSVTCNGEAQKPGAPATVSISASSGALCTFTNRIAYVGRISIFKEALGNTGTASFLIARPGDPTFQLNQTAVVTKEGAPTRAVGDSSRDLAFGTYAITESDAQPDDADNWSLIEVVCNGRAVPFSQGRALVHLSRVTPHVTCRFVNRFHAGPEPPTPGPDPKPGETVEIAVTKTLVKAGTGSVPTDVFRIGVKNLSGVTAQGVVVTDQAPAGLVVISAEPSAGGSCTSETQYICTFASIPPHGEASVIVTAKDYAGTASSNRAIAGSATPDPNAADNVAAARVAKPVRRFHACGSSRSLAHAAC